MTVSKVDELWFDDGNLVIGCPASGAEGTEVRFKVHRGLLKSRSPVWNDMLSIGPSDAEETFEGVDFVRMYDDAHDMEEFLKVLYWQKTLDDYCTEPSAMRMKPLIGATRIATKYDVGVLLPKARALVTRSLPTTLQEWNEYVGKNQPSQPPPEEARIGLIPFVRIGKELDMPEILRAAFYDAFLKQHQRERDSLDHSDLLIIMDARVSITRWMHEILMAVCERRCLVHWAAGRACGTLRGDDALDRFFQNLNVIAPAALGDARSTWTTCGQGPLHTICLPQWTRWQRWVRKSSAYAWSTPRALHAETIGSKD